MWASDILELYRQRVGSPGLGWKRADRTQGRVCRFNLPLGLTSGSLPLQRSPFGQTVDWGSPFADNVWVPSVPQGSVPQGPIGGSFHVRAIRLGLCARSPLCCHDHSRPQLSHHPSGHLQPTTPPHPLCSRRGNPQSIPFQTRGRRSLDHPPPPGLDDTGFLKERTRSPPPPGRTPPGPHHRVRTSPPLHGSRPPREPPRARPTPRTRRPRAQP